MQQQESNPFRPQINESSKKMKRGQKFLIEDTKRRMSQKKAILSIQSQKALTEVAQINAKSDKVIYERFDQEFSRACKQIGVLPENAKDEELEHENVNISVMSSLLGNLGFIENNGINEKDQAHIASIWKTLGGEQDRVNKVPLQHVKVVMCAIQNFHIDWILDPEREDETGVNP